MSDIVLRLYDIEKEIADSKLEIRNNLRRINCSLMNKIPFFQKLLFMNKLASLDEAYPKPIDNEGDEL